VEDVVRAALQEDADAIALSSYQGGHVEYFKYMVDMLRERGASHIRVFGGGGGTITPEEIRELQDYGVERIYHPNDGMHMGLVAMIEDVVRRQKPRASRSRPAPGGSLRRNRHRRDAQRHRGKRAGRIPARAPAQAVAAGRRQDAGDRHHRHRRRRQVLGHRRAAQPLPRLLPRHAPGGHLRRPHAPPLPAVRCWATASA
jgi:methylmalonyl-CoA mutase cobalamin-binding domain/chain